MDKSEGSYTLDAKGVEPNNGHYVKGNGKLSGEYYFAPAEGLVVEAALKSKLNQSYTFDGLLVGYWMTPKERVSPSWRTAPCRWSRGRESRRSVWNLQAAGRPPAEPVEPPMIARRLAFLIPVLGLALGLAWHLPSSLAQAPGGASGRESGPSLARNSKVVRNFREETWVFDIQNGNIRFSHGNHKSRDRWFRAYFRKNYDCEIRHNTSLPVDDSQGGITLSAGEGFGGVEEIRAAKDEPYAYGVKMLTCLGACHNGFTAPKDCAWCHLPESKPIREGQTEIKKW